MSKSGFRALFLGIGMCSLAPFALAADRHVFLDTDGDGKLNQCPNPLHNTFASPSSGNLQYCACTGAGCSDATKSGKVLGDKTGYVTSAICTGAGGTVTDAVNGVSADILGNGAAKTIYGHPQPCVWRMNTSDSCEVHAGTYRASGSYADSNALDSGTGAGSGCDKNNCWFATVLAPGPASGGAYGTPAAPGYLRGAVMNGSTDTWDPNGDKNPADGSYPAIFSGDRNGDGVFQETTGQDADNSGSFTGMGANFRGDAYIGVVVGCEDTSSSGYSWCGTGHSDSPWIDTDANGTFETRGNIGNRNPAYFVVKDIEFKGYNGGINVANAAGIRAYSGIINLPGNGSSDGLVVDHVYVHGNDFSYTAANENYWTILDDSHNGHCTKWTDIKNSNFEQNNDKVLDDDCGVGNECGCPKHFHDNIVVRNITSPRGAVSDKQVFFYLKSVDTFDGGTKKKVHRIWNNQFIIAPTTTQSGTNTFMDLQAFGNSLTHGLGELWVYGNIFRTLGSAKMKRVWSPFCGQGTGAYKVFMFGNTFDMTFLANADGIGQVCNDPGTLLVEKNNAYWSGTTVVSTHQSLASTIVRANEFCSTTDTACTKPSLTGRTDWFTASATSAYDGLTAYLPKNAGPLYHSGSCDPDGDGTSGVDYDGDGINDTTWKDIAGNTVSCPTVATPFDAGAIQSGPSGPVDTTPPATVSGVKRLDKKP